MSLLDDLGARPGPPRRRIRGAWLVLALFAVLLVAGYVALHQYATHRVPPGTSVAGLRLGGLTQEQARERLESLVPTLSEPLTLLHGENRYPLVPTEAGVDVDVDATLTAIGADHERWTPTDLWGFVAGGRAGAPVLRVEDQRFAAALDRLTGQLARPMVEGGVRFVDGRARAVHGQAGLVVDHVRTRALVERLLFARHPAELPVTRHDPAVDQDAVRRAMTEFARPAMSAPVRVVLAGSDGGRYPVLATPRMVGQALTMAPRQGGLVPVLDGDRLAATLWPALRTLGPTPRDGTVELREGRPVVVPAIRGASLRSDLLARRVLAALTRPAKERAVRVPATITEPARTTRAARALRITHRVGVATVAGDSALVERVDGVLVRPGGTLALAERLGQPSRPLASALFGAALRAGLPIPVYHPVPAYDPRLPVGQQMTDVSVRAPGGAGLLVVARRDGTDSARQITVELWSARRAPARVRVGAQRHRVPATLVQSTDPGCEPRAGSDGFEVRVRRHRPRVREAFVSRYAPVDGVRCSAPASPVPASPGPTR